ncbi:hypothetical protein [Halosimplex sp. J119]
MSALSVTRYHGPAIAVFLLGVAVLGYVGVTAADLTRTEYVYDVESISDADLPDDAQVRRYENLSATAQDAFRGALSAPDGEYVADEAAPDITYADDVYPEGTHYVRYESDLYRFHADGPGGASTGIAIWILFVLIAPVGLVIAAIGAVSFGLDLLRLPVAVLAGLVVGFAVVAATDRGFDGAALAATTVAALGWLGMAATGVDAKVPTADGS